MPRSPSPITSTAFDRQVVRLHRLSSATGACVLDVAQRNFAKGDGPASDLAALTFGPSESAEPAGTARPHLLRISGARKSVVAVTGRQHVCVGAFSKIEIAVRPLCPAGHHFIVIVIKAKLAETSTPSLAPRSSSTTPFSLRNLTPETPAATAAPPPTPRRDHWAC